MANPCWSRNRSRHPLPMPSASRVLPPIAMLRDGRDVDALPAGGAGSQKLIDDGAIGTITGIEADLPIIATRIVDEPLLQRRARRRCSARPRRLSRCRWRFICSANRKKFPAAGTHRKAASICGANSTCNSPAQTAHLSCGFDRDGANQFVIHGSKAVLRLEAPFLKAQKLARFSPALFRRDAEGWRCRREDH